MIPQINNSFLRQLNSFVFFFAFFLGTTTVLHGQVSLPNRNPFKLTIRGGAMSNNHDMEAHLIEKVGKLASYTVNTDYAAIGEAELSADLFRFRGAAIHIQVSGMYARPEFKSKGADGTHRVGLTQLEIARANLVFSFNGSDPYTMFELPYHSNKEAFIGATGMIVRTEKTQLTQYAMENLGIKRIHGEYCQALGVTFGWNWRLGESGWVLGFNGAVMFVINKSHLVKVETDDVSPYASGVLDFAPRMATAGIGYHF